MRTGICFAMLAVLMLAGCAEQGTEGQLGTDADGGATGGGEGTPPPPPPPRANGTQDAGPDPLEGRIVLDFPVLNVTAAVPFNLTVDYVDDDSADLQNLSWEVVFTPSDDLDEANRTANTTAFDGVGLPALVEVNLTYSGNMTVEALVTDGSATVEEGLPVTVFAPPVGDPCAPVPAQDPITMTGLIGPGAAGSGLVTSNEFEVQECQSGMTIVLTTTTGAADVIIHLFTADGQEITQDANFVAPNTETLVYQPAGGLPPGGYNARVDPFAVVADEYEITITFDE